MILHEKTKQEFGYEFDTATIRSEFYCICDYCGKEFLRCKKTIVQCNKVVAKDSCGVGQCKKKKSEEVQMIKFGVPNVGGTPENMAKKIKTSLEKYGAKNYNQSEQCVKDNREKYGVDYPIQLEDTKEKVKKTRIKNYGVDHHTRSAEYQDKRRQKCLKKYGVIHHSKTDDFKNKLRETFRKKYGADSLVESDYFRKLMEDRGNTNHYGKTQQQIKEFLDQFNYNFVNNRSLLESKEIDLYADELKLGIEYCGLYWHHELSPQPRYRGYHYDKYLKCKEKGVRLITIFEDEWKTKQSICKSILKNIVQSNTKIYARNCVVGEISTQESNEFCRNYHLLGQPRTVLFSCGLFYKDELVGVMSLGRHHRGYNGIILNRLCFKSNFSVLGGASKVLKPCRKWCLENGHKSIITWSDNRWSTGNVYQKMGFRLDKELPPDYSYVLSKGGKVIRLSKQSCRKKRKHCPEGKTEREWMAELGYARIWDCGKKRWKKNLEK